MEILFWTLAAAVAWCYAGYPLYTAALARLRPRPLRPAPPGWQPSVTAVVAVRNEKASLQRRVENLLEQHYPTAWLDVVVVCNGSSDGSEEIARELARRNPRVRVLVSPAELGKAGAINMAVAESAADVIVFADARQTFAPDVIRRLVDVMGDPSVGVVSGRLVVQRTDLPSVEGVRRYWGLEMYLREAESRSGSVVQALGAIYAVRRSLFPSVPPNLILDDVFVPMRIAMRGYRVVMAADAIGYDVPARNQKAEYLRKRRTMVGNIQLLRALPEVLSPFHNPLFFRFVSHKLLRLLTPLFFMGMLVVSAMIPETFYRVLFAAELTLYVLGVVGLWVSLPGLSVPAAFVLVHVAILAAMYRWRQDASQVWSQAVVPPVATPLGMANPGQ